MVKFTFILGCSSVTREVGRLQYRGGNKTPVEEQFHPCQALMHA